MAITRANDPMPVHVPRVSVLMPVFNTGPFLHDALQSISEQTYRDLEIIVVDDGSTDSSARILHAFAAAEPRMRVVCRMNRGLIATRNELLSMARGELVAWMDSDDVSLPERLALQVAAFDADLSLSALGGVAQCIDPEGNALNVERYPSGHDDIRHMQSQGRRNALFPRPWCGAAPRCLPAGFANPSASARISTFFFASANKAGSRTCPR